MSEHPTLHVTNWSSWKRLHGPGRAFTMMANPRHWERGKGRVPRLTPMQEWVRDAKAGRLSLDAYRALYDERLVTSGQLAPYGHIRDAKGRRPVGSRLAPGELYAVAWGGPNIIMVGHGDTLCCACSRAKAAAGECHRVWAAEALVRAGWRVILDGQELHP
jgi:hypothetical protein